MVLCRFPLVLQQRESERLGVPSGACCCTSGGSGLHIGAMCWIALAGCSEELPRVLIIALDGADMRQIERLSEQGRLPHLKALIEQGASGRLETVSSMSPVAWTSVATGVRPGKHGINAYVAFQGRPLSAVDRRRPAFWNILSHYRRTVGVIGWWLTFPQSRSRAISSLRTCTSAP